jgi:predicted nucleic acid-binding protein
MPLADFVLDCSVTLSWYFKDEADPYADGVLARLTRGRALVPGLWPLEVANAILVGERRRRSTPAQAKQWIALVEALPIDVDRVTGLSTIGPLADLGRSLQLSAYDAAYIDLALRHGLPLATLDDQLKKAAKTAGVKLLPKI